MPRSRRFRKNTEKPEWGKNNPQTKAKNQKNLIILGVIIAAVVVISAALVLGGAFSKPSTSPTPSPTASPTATPSPTPTVTPSPSTSPTPTPVPTAAPTPATSPVGEYSANGTKILIKTSMGDFVIQLRDDKPITAGNFKNITALGLYDATIFHRIIGNFMVQGGGIESVQIPMIPDEIGNDNRNVVGTIAMANAGPNTANSQFFINVADNSQIVYDNGVRFDDSYTVFGKVIRGMDVVMSMSRVATTSSDMPVNVITLIRAEILP